MKNTSRKPIKWENAEYHRKAIIDIVRNIDNSWILWQIHRLCVNILR